MDMNVHTSGDACVPVCIDPTVIRVQYYYIQYMYKQLAEKLLYSVRS
jgi:hypothetical protein